MTGATLEDAPLVVRARAARSLIAAERPPLGDREELLAAALWPRPLLGEGDTLDDLSAPVCAAQSAARRPNRRRW